MVLCRSALRIHYQWDYCLGREEFRKWELVFVSIRNDLANRSWPQTVVILNRQAAHGLKAPLHYFSTRNSQSSSQAHTSASCRHGASSQQWVADLLHVLQKLNKRANTTQPYKQLPLLSSSLQAPRGIAGTSEAAISSSSNTQGQRQRLWVGPRDEQSTTAPREAMVPMRSIWKLA